MEENTLKFNNLQLALNKFIQELCSTYKSLLIRDNKKATGELIKSIKPYSLEFSNNKLVGEISLASYWKYVEYGRRPGKFPPVNKILDWIRVKPVIPRPINGLKPPTEPQLAFLISRKIAREGIEPGNQLDEAMNLVWERNKDNISNAISKDLQAYIDLIKI